MTCYTGLYTGIGLGEEVAYGTAVARTNWRPVVSASLKRVVTKQPRGDLFADSGGNVSRSHFVSKDIVQGTVKILATYNSVGMLLKHALGGESTAGTSAPYTHTYVHADALPVGLTIELIRGRSGNSEVFEGCKITRFKFECSAAGEAMIEFDFIGETSAARASAGTPTYTVDVPVLHNHAGDFNFNSVAYDTLTSITLEVDNGLTERQFLGSNTTKEPCRNGRTTVRMDVAIEAVDALYTAMTADTESDADMTFSSGTNSFKVEAHNAYVDGWSDDIGGAEIVTASGTFIGQSDGTDLGVEVVVVNDNASSTAN